MLVSEDAGMIEQARFLATQARDPAPHYQHSQVGFNYRLSNVLAAIGRGQMRVLEARVAARRRNYDFYLSRLGGFPGIDLIPRDLYGRSNCWLTCVTIDPKRFGANREEVRLALVAHEIEARPVWKPLHLQPVFSGCRAYGGQIAERIFNFGLCLPSGSNLDETDLERICACIGALYRKV